MALVWMIIHVSQDKFQHSEKMTQCVRYVMEKFKKYYVPIPMTFIIAQFFDPQMKHTYLIDAMDRIYGAFPEMGLNVNNEYNNAVRSLEQRYRVYEATFGGQRGEQQHSRSSSSTSQFLRMLRPQAGSSSSQTTSDYNRYMTMPLVPSDETIDLLAWWKNNSQVFPILSIMAKDFLTIPMSSVASESAFSQGKKQIPPHRESMAGITLEMIVCLKDWFDAEDDSQTGVMLDIEMNHGSSSPETGSSDAGSPYVTDDDY